jgi:acyl-[acyl-carrier-protein]-phospholipid O-acyltransferase / long-chain-fatty-acid--[acyl-carrier-protein] ligase
MTARIFRGPGSRAGLEPYQLGRWHPAARHQFASHPLYRLVGKFQIPYLIWLANLAEAIMISNKPKEVVRALREAREALQRGELVCIFPEGGISRSGQLQGFKPGIMKILEGTDAPVVPVLPRRVVGKHFQL